MHVQLFVKFQLKTSKINSPTIISDWASLLYYYHHPYTALDILINFIHSFDRLFHQAILSYHFPKRPTPSIWLPCILVFAFYWLIIWTSIVNLITYFKPNDQLCKPLFYFYCRSATIFPLYKWSRLQKNFWTMASKFLKTCSFVLYGIVTCKLKLDVWSLYSYPQS